MEGFPILSLMLLVPMIGAVLCLFVGDKAARAIALAATGANLALGIALWASYDIGGAQWQFQEAHPIFAGFQWALGIDGIALMLIVLSVFLMPICILASASIDKRVGEYMAAFLFMETLMIGVFAMTSHRQPRSRAAWACGARWKHQVRRRNWPRHSIRLRDSVSTG